MVRKYFLRLLTLAIVVSALVPTQLVLAVTTDSATLNVGFTIPTTGGGGNVGGGDPPGGGGPGGGNNAPVISGVVTAVTTNSATVTWSATDDTGLATVTFEYGTSVAYGTPGTVTGTFTTTLNGLSAGSQYFFKITATDTSGKVTTSLGSFVTASVAGAFTISDIKVTPGETSALVEWTTSVSSDSQVLYGQTVSYTGTAVNADLVTTHTLTLINLLPNTTYHFKISSTDAFGNQLDANDGTFTTLPDAITPPDVQGFQGAAVAGGIQLSWTNPDPALFPDVNKINIVRKVGSNHPTTPTDGTLVYSGLATSFNDNSVVADVLYSYTAFTYDTSNNVSGGTSVSALKTSSIPQVEICANGIDDDANGLTDCADAACASGDACVVFPTEQCSNGVDDDNNGLADCADAACSQNAVCVPGGPGAEVCGNGIDDDLNNKIDCADAACTGFSGCINEPNPVTPGSIPESTVGSNLKIDLSKIKFMAGARAITLAPANGVVRSLAGTQLSIVIPDTVFSKKPEAMNIVINGTETHQFVYSIPDGYYYSDIVLPPVGEWSAYVRVQYSESEIDIISFKLATLPWGDIMSSGARVAGASVELIDTNGRRVVLDSYGQQNPFTVGVNANYGFVVPNGTYQLKISAAGFYERVSVPFVVTDNVVNKSFELIVTPRPLLENTDPTKTVIENAGIIAKNLSDRSAVIGKQVLQIISDARADEQTQNVVSNIVVPSVVAVSAASFLSFISFSNLLPLLRLLFLQPLLLLGRKKREGWGQVYNSLTKLPVDLATLRLVNAATNQVVQTKVTDAKGRYAFVAQPGTYRIEVLKGNMKFPSELLKSFTEDGRKTDIYHGETITVSDKDAVVTANVPLDPLGDASVPARLRLQMVSRFFKIVLSFSGLALTAFSFYLSPRWYVGALLVVHAVLFAVFRRLAIPPKIKSWGIVYEEGTKLPVGRTVARLFNAQFNKLVSTQITDTKGRYYFMAGDDKYYVTYEHPSYEVLKSNQVDLGGKEAEPIALDVALKKK